MPIIPLPSELHLHFHIGDITCNCGPCCNDGQATSVISRNLEPTTESTPRIPRDLRVVVDQEGRALKVRPTWKSLTRLNHPGKENQKTIKAYYTGLVSQINQELEIPEENAPLGHLLVHVLASKKGVNLTERYHQGKPLTISEIARMSRSLRKVKDYAPLLKALMEHIGNCHPLPEGEEQDPLVCFDLTCLTHGELNSIKQKINEVKDALGDLWKAPLPKLTQAEAERVIEVARKAFETRATTVES